MIIIEGEEYCNAKEAAELLRVSRATFYNNAKPLLVPCDLPARKIVYYRVGEIKQKFVVSHPEMPPEERKEVSSNVTNYKDQA